MKIVNEVLKDVTNEDIVDERFVVSEGVTSIEDFAFENCRFLVSIHISKSVTQVRKSAFYEGSHLEKLITL